MVIDNHRLLGTNRGPRKTVKSLTLFVPGPVPWAQLMWVQSWVSSSCKSLISNHYFFTHFPHLPGRGTFQQGTILLKTQTASKIPLMISMSIAEANSLKALETTQTGIRRVRDSRLFILLQSKYIYFPYKSQYYTKKHRIQSNGFSYYYFTLTQSTNFIYIWIFKVFFNN